MQTKMRVDMLVRLSSDPEIKHSAAGTEWASLSVAHNDGSGDKSVVHFVRVKVFGKGVDTIRDLRKGDPINIEGDLKIERWDDKNTGQKREAPVVIATWIRHLRSKAESEAARAKSGAASQQQQQPAGGFTQPQAPVHQPAPDSSFGFGGGASEFNDIPF